jgi:hypothetical protein
MGDRPVLWIAILALALAGGCARKPDDAALVTNIKSQVFSDRLLKDADLRVSSNKGEVTLSGTVPNDAARQEAYKIALQAPGVVKVNDQMTVEAAQAAPETAPIVAPASPVAPTAVHNRHAKKKGEPTFEEMKSTDNAPQPKISTQLQIQGTPLPSAVQPAPPPQLAPTPVQTAPLPTPRPAAPAPPQPKDVVVPASSTVTVRMIDTVDSSVNHAGEIFHAALEVPLVVDNQVVVPRGADIYVRLASSKSAGRLRGKSELHMELLKLEFQGRSYSLYSSTYSVSGSSHGKNTAKKVGGGAAVGAVIGAIAGAGAGAAIGAGVGAGAGAVWSGVMKGKQVKIPAETKLDFQLEQPVTVTVIPRPTLAAK